MKYDKDIVVKWFAQHGILAIPEHKFDDDRKWRFDFIVAELPQGTLEIEPMLATFQHILRTRVALEVEGGVWTGGRHTRGSGFVKDMEKYNRAAVLGWRILRVTPSDLCMQETVDVIKEALRV